MGHRRRPATPRTVRQASSGPAIGPEVRIRDGRRRRRAETSSESSSVRLGASPTQKGMVGWAPSASTTRTSPWVDPADPPGVGPEEEDVAHHRLDGEVLVDRAHRGVVGIEDDPVVADLGDGAPEVRAASRAPRRGRRMPLTRSRCR
jgi:hypothetical protein